MQEHSTLTQTVSAMCEIFVSRDGTWWNHQWLL